jgi:hypothetical protein
MLATLKAFLASVPLATKGILSAEELYRSVLTALGSGSILGIVILSLQAIVNNAAVIFPNPIVASLATMLLTLVLDQVRRINHGTDPAPTPAPAPAPPAAA